MEKNQNEVHHHSTWEDRLADRVAAFCGNMKFVYFHLGWFFIWVILNVVGFIEVWDPFPFALLTMIVSLEAIVLSTFILISQNRQSQISDARSQRDYAIDKKAELEIEEIKITLKRILENQEDMMKK
ncbi:MAG: hypothetical protein A2898_01490 [Candidatus Kerfeldbacteria bacterium RIFCSPLOWO2_01_FULL_48_11]|uniref:DUF1003 domain-containing protein n=1 Tax=Candidatus Kerfeldbacteria bacterium RIFCSPLOWO2_01_FULL_48_11 TaxID=1798543 RepID=A0A1G2B407_9BACT|nr:MAG: hypothetical protein UY34_C0010G0043 [Parcubacteria group bacterium GW2011_GWA2_48_9]KKW16506.1 MAG: hypothetical protein UY52_C0003G0002 [Parcubacteria group bacterium GW2011_GWC2_49_9]OGY83931.1 MAG: hypothetical protein A2898_01490 [Candidatus Kerfeldbacteria bacterium RIFCSPLOWO2_01_FULL_48_11]HCM68145.1 hypothetical protein [Candidatus Kerfeldbacteria bacterium]